MDRVIHKEDGIEYTHNPYTGKCLTCGSLTAYSGFCFECDKENRMTTDFGMHPNDEIYGEAKKPQFDSKSTFACPVCGSHVSRVWSKVSDDSTAVRIRKCECGHRFQTVERVSR